MRFSAHRLRSEFAGPLSRRALSPCLAFPVRDRSPGTALLRSLSSCWSSSTPSGLQVRQQLADELHVARRDERLPRVPALAPRRLVLIQVAFVRLHARQLSGARGAEALLRTAVAFHLGHGVTTSKGLT